MSKMSKRVLMMGLLATMTMTPVLSVQAQEQVTQEATSGAASAAQQAADAVVNAMAEAAGEATSQAIAENMPTEEDIQSAASQIQEAAGTATSDQISKVLEFVKEKAANGQLENTEDIQQAITEGEQSFGYKMDEGQKQKLLQGVEALHDMGLSTDQIISQAEDVYEKYGADAVNHIGEVAADTIGKSIQNGIHSAIENFILKLQEMLRNFVNGLFGKIGG